MQRVHAITQHPIPNSQLVAVVIGESDTDQRHIGILHRKDNAPPEVLHLAWHCQLENDNVMPAYFTLWIEPAFPVERLRQVTASCRRVWKKNGKGGVPYAFSNPEGAFDKTTASFLVGPTRFGLTCATFVLSVFERVGLPIAALDTWPVNRQGDQAWQEKVIAALERRATKEHLEHIRSEVGAVRYRPEEVAAAATIAPPAAKFEDVEPISLTIAARTSTSSP